MENNKPLAKARFSVEVEDTNVEKEYKFDIGLYIFKENGCYIAYSPALDLSSYSDTFNSAISAFYEAFQLHVEYCLEHNTLKQSLEELGWEFKHSEIKEPSMTYLLQSEKMNSIFNGGFNYQYMISPISIPAFAL